MIHITQGQTNKVVFTATENVTIVGNVYFLVEFVSEQTKSKYYCTGTDLSGFPYRFNEFDITEKANPVLTNSEVQLSVPGQYVYNVYQQSSPTNLDPANAISIVETGKCEVHAASTVAPAIYDLQPKTNTAYVN